MKPFLSIHLFCSYQICLFNLWAKFKANFNSLLCNSFCHEKLQENNFQLSQLTGVILVATLIFFYRKIIAAFFLNSVFKWLLATKYTIKFTTIHVRYCSVLNFLHRFSSPFICHNIPLFILLWRNSLHENSKLKYQTQSLCLFLCTKNLKYLLAL